MMNDDPGFRWEHGIPHHPKSLAIMEHLKAVETKFGDVFDWKTGGDGDNGEELMYQLDSFFEYEGEGR
jgi:hypothetical protein